jgi:tetratricopeptide (TPR) repeat protein
VIFNELNKGNFFDEYFEFLSNYMPTFPLGLVIRYLFIIPFLILILGILIFLYATYQIVITLFLSAIAIACGITLFVLGCAIITNVVFPKKGESNVRKPISLYILLFSLASVLISQFCLSFVIPIIQHIYNNNTISLPLTALFYSLLISGFLGTIVTIAFIAISIKIQKAERTGVDLGRRGIELCNSEEYDEALKLYDRALEIDPYNAKTWYNRGVLMGKLKKYEDGIQNFEKAMEINPSYENAKKGRENFLKELNK